jgi:starch-binding outer membrane protein, SusD/RagB family
MKSYKIILFLLAILGIAMNSCVKDLDTTPNDPNTVTSASVFNDPASYKKFLAKIYGGLTLTGLGTASDPGVGDPDIVVPDEGTASYLRLYWNAQELTTDEAVNGWNDGDLNEFHFQNWGADNGFVGLMYTRIYYNIALCNEYLRDVNSLVGGLSGTLKTDVTKYLAEVRFLRALSYYHAMDMYINVPFVTEKDPIGSFYPKPISRTNLFNYVVSELKAISPILASPRTNEYARADKAAAWSLLAKTYLNAKVYTGTAKYDSCAIYCDSVINAGYSLHSSFAELFLADNDQCKDEFIFAVAHDGLRTKTYGGMTYIIQAEVGGSMKPADYGVTGWWGNRVTSALVNKFDLTNDKRAMFYTAGQNLEITSTSSFTDGYAVSKFKNITSKGVAGSSNTFVDTDFPLFRLADIYLMYAEAYAMGATKATAAKALGYVNAIRERAYGNTSGDLAAATDITPNFILDERARELFWECTRRTDLVRFNKFTEGTYVWPWKGKVKAGVVTSSLYNIFPIPSSDLAANPNLSNPKGY